MKSTQNTNRYIPKSYLTEAEDVVFSLPEFTREEKLEFLTKRIRENWDENPDLETVKAALDQTLETF